jgi:hypothetical protein
MNQISQKFVTVRLQVQDLDEEPDSGCRVPSYWLSVGELVLVVLECSKDHRGKTMIARSLILLYEVEFADGNSADCEYTAIVIAENMWTQCDPNGNQFRLMEGIADHWKVADAVPKEESIHRKYADRYTAGWFLCV